jgi:hypothetical protein
MALKKHNNKYPGGGTKCFNKKFFKSSKIILSLKNNLQPLSLPMVSVHLKPEKAVYGIVRSFHI